MNIQERIERIEALEAECYERFKALKVEVQRENEFPQDGDEYWSISETGEIIGDKWDSLDFEKNLLALGNVYKTKEQAEFAVEKLKVEAELRKFSRPFECGEINHYIFLDTNNGCLDVVGLGYSQYQGTIYFESEEKAQQAIESVGKDRIKKYIF